MHLNLLVEKIESAGNYHINDWCVPDVVFKH